MTTTILIRELDGTAPETVDLLLPLLTASFAHDLVGHPAPIPEMVGVLLTQRANQVATVFAAFDEQGVPTTYARVCHDTNSNRTLAYGTMWSDPRRRREGFGSALLPRLQEWARANGCDRLVLDAPAAEGSVAFADRHSGRLVGTEKRSMLDLRKIDRAQFEKWATPYEANAEYRTVRWSGAVPDDLVESYVRARNAMHDAPRGELELEFKELTVREQREGESNAMARGLMGHMVAAVARDGSVAGYTQVFTYPGTGFGLAHIGDTAVVSAHRGHGLGLRLKAENTLWILDNLPHVDVIDTWNNEDNAPMLRVNILMGYVFADLWQNFQFDL